MTSLARTFLEGRGICRVARAGLFVGEIDILSSRPSSSAFRFRLPILRFVCGETIIRCQY